MAVYVDVNGLHEHNNEKGHGVSNEMLKMVAGMLKNDFGYKHTYRLGGDEFQDVSANGLTNVHKAMEAIDHQLQKQDDHMSYSLAQERAGEAVMKQAKRQCISIKELTT